MVHHQKLDSKGFTTFERLNELRVTGTKTDLDGQEVPLIMFNSEVGKAIKTNYAFPVSLL